MTGRVLSEEELNRHYENHRNFVACDEDAPCIVCDYHATIRDRDESLALDAEIMDSEKKYIERLQQQNTILREALEEIAGYQIGEKGTCDINLYYCVTDAREALAKVKEV